MTSTFPTCGGARPPTSITFAPLGHPYRARLRAALPKSNDKAVDSGVECTVVGAGDRRPLSRAIRSRLSRRSRPQRQLHRTRAELGARSLTASRSELSPAVCRSSLCPAALLAGAGVGLRSADRCHRKRRCSRHRREVGQPGLDAVLGPAGRVVDAALRQHRPAGDHRHTGHRRGRQAVYLAAMIGDASGAHHRLFALSLKDGAPLPGWPIDVAEALTARGQHFNTRFQNQRGALAILDGRVYVPYGGHSGDCGDYHGWVLGIRLQDPRDIVSWSTRGRGGGIWASGGISSDGRVLFVATGNTIGTSTWSDGEAVIRLMPDLRHEEQPRDFFTPSDWRTLDERDADLGGSNPLLLSVPSGEVPLSAGPKPLVLALGKDARVYLLDGNNLGGIGGSLTSAVVSTRSIRTAPAAYPAADGIFVAFQGPGELP